MLTDCIDLHIEYFIAKIDTTSTLKM